MTTLKRGGSTQNWKWLLPLVAVLALSVLLKLTIVGLGVVDFTSDEGVIALMARHTTQGKWPVFYYGEAYVGSLGATLTAGAFLLLGESVLTARIVQIVFYMGTIVFTYLLAQRIFGCKAAAVSGLMMALPPVMTTLYTTVGIGAYGETLLFGTMLLWLGHRLAYEWADKWISWLVWGAVAGLGFWSLGLIVVYIVPVAVLLLTRFNRRHWPHYLVAVLGFFLCSSPWWIYDFSHNHAGFRVFLEPSNPVVATLAAPLLVRLQLFILFGVPALMGLRFPWAAGYTLVYLAPLVLTFYIVVLLGIKQHWSTLSPLGKSGILLLALFVVVFALLFFGSQFGMDVTGRFLLPLYPPLCIAIGGWWSRLRSRARAWGSVALALILAFNLIGTVLGSMEPAGLTTVYFPAQQVGNAHDEELIDFLLSNEMPYGYSHHWVSFKLAFLSREQVILAPLLPYQIAPEHDLERADRYPPYTALAESAANPVYVTSNQPWLDGLLSQRLMELGITYEETRIGPYHIFYHLSQPLSPGALELFSAGGNSVLLSTLDLEGYTPQYRGAGLHHVQIKATMYGILSRGQVA